MKSLISVNLFLDGLSANSHKLATAYLGKYSPMHILIDFWPTVKAVTLRFIYGRGSAISSAKQGKSGSFYKLVKSFWPSKRACIS